MAKILITGGSGFIGRYAYERLLGRHDLTIYDLVKPTWSIAPATLVQGDIRDAALMRSSLRGHDAVLHLAAAHHDFGIADDTYYAVNAGGMETLCAAADEADLSRASRRPDRRRVVRVRAGDRPGGRAARRSGGVHQLALRAGPDDGGAHQG